MVRRVIKAAGKRVSMADPEDLAKLIAIREELDQAIQAAVDGLREDGFTWRTIGEATGTTGQAANMKWGKGGEVAEGADNVRYVEIDTEWAVNHSHTVTVGE
jgi:hypothetical protein